MSNIFNPPKTMSSSDIRTLHTLVVQTLGQCTGLSLNQRKLVACWVIATHALPSLNLFPILCLRGSMGTGKSQCLSTIANFCHAARRITLEGSTLPTIRDEFEQARFGTMVIEEGDHAWGDENRAVERLLNARYSIDTERASLKVQTTIERTTGRSKETSTINKTDERRIFGGTVIHRREQWRDPVLSTKSILVLFRPAMNRDPETLQRFDPEWPWCREGRELTQNGTVLIDLPTAKRPARIFSRTWDTWEPVVRAAMLLADEEFDSWLAECMLAESERLTRSQGAEPEVVALNVLLSHVFNPSYSEPNFDPVRLSVLVQKLREDRIDMISHKLASHLRELGFRLAKSGGDIKVYPTPQSIVRGAEKAGVTDDEAVNALAEKMGGKNAAIAISEKENTGGVQGRAQGTPPSSTFSQKTNDLTFSNSAKTDRLQ